MSGLPGQQTVSRYRTVAFQAVGVALIAAFVFIAFLRPSEPDRLSGIDAPGGDNTPFAVDQPPDKKGKKGGNKNQNRPTRGGPGGRRGGPGGGEPGGSSSSAPSGSGGGTTTPPGGGDPGGSGGGEDPPGSQYDSLPDLLMEEVGSPALFRGIEP